MLAAPCVGSHSGIVDLCTIFACRAGVSFRPLWSSVAGVSFLALFALRATLTLNALRPLLTTRTSFTLRTDGPGSTHGALWTSLALWADRADRARIALVALKVTSCNAVLQLL